MAWTSGKLTDVRCTALWLSGASLLNSLASVLMANIRDERPEAVGFVDMERARVEDELTTLIFSTWYKQGAIPTDSTTGELFRDVEDPETMYLAYVDDWVTETWRVVEGAARTQAIDGTWTVTAWHVENVITGRRYELRAEAGLWTLSELIDVVIDPAVRKLSATLRATIGTQTTVEAWRSLEAEAFSEAERELWDACATWMRNEKALPGGFYAIKSRVQAAGAAVYKSGMSFTPLQMSLGDAQAILRELDEMMLAVPERNAGEFAYVYQVVSGYMQMLGGAERPDETYPYPREVPSSERLGTVLQNEVDKRWDVKQWVRISETAAAKNQDVQLGALIASETESISQAILAMLKDQWSGPLTHQADGTVVPYGGVPIGEALYLGWVDGLVDAAYDRIYAWVQGVESVERQDEYVVPAVYVESLTTMLRRLWYTDVSRGVYEVPDSLSASVKDRFWYDVEGGLLGYVGMRVQTIEVFQGLVWAFYMGKRAEALQSANGMMTGTGREWPSRFVEIETMAEGGVTSSTDASSYILELDGLRGVIPQDGAGRFDATYGKLLAVAMTLSGGVQTVVWRAESSEYYTARVEEFDTQTEDDERLANEMGSDYRAEREKFTKALWDALAALEGRTDVTERAIGTQRSEALIGAWDAYGTWRVGVYDAADAKLAEIVARAEAGQTTDEDVAWLQRVKAIDHEHLRNGVRSAEWILTQPREVTGGVSPFTRFKPLKSVSGFDVEEYSAAHLEKVFENWATAERLAGGIAVEPKINGYRLILESKGKVARVYMEGATKDFAGTYKHLAADVSAAGDVILDGELVEEVEGRVGERAELAKYRAAGADDTAAIVNVFDILYEGERGSLVDEPYEERRAVLELWMKAHTSQHWRILPNRVVHTAEELRAAVEWADAYPGSEGCMMKALSSVYLVGRRTRDWAKIKRTSDLQVIVLGVTTTKAGDYVPRCGVLYDGNDVDPADIETLGTRRYVVLGNAFRTKLKVKVGDILEVQVNEVVEQSGARGKRWNWMLPKVKDFSDKPVSTLGYTRSVRDLLTASDDTSWRRIRDIEEDAMAATTMEQLNQLELGIWSLLSDLNAARLRAYAWAVLQLIRGRLYKVIDPRLGNLESLGATEKRYELGVAPDVTVQMIEELEAALRGVEETVDEGGAKRLEEARRLLTMVLQVTQNNRNLTLGMRLSELESTLRAFIQTLSPTARSVLEITADFAQVQGKVEDLRTRPPENAEELAAEYMKELNVLLKEVGSSNEELRIGIEEVAFSFDEFMNPPMASKDVRVQLSDYVEIMTRIRGELSRRELSSVPDLNMIERGLRSLQVKLQPWQREVFASHFVGMFAEIDVLQTKAEEIKRGELTGSWRPRKLDLGCGKTKPEGYVGVDKIAQRGVDRVWDLERGIPYADGAFDEVRAIHVLEHLSDPVAIMSEIWRVLADGGVVEFEVPSTRGEGAFANPDHKSFWNKLTFAFFEDDELRESAGVPCKFRTLELDEREDPESGAVYVHGRLAADKHEGKARGELQASVGLTSKGEKSGQGRTNFMQEEPSKVPVTGKLWLHFKGIAPEHRGWSMEQLIEGGEVLSVHGDLRFDWQPHYLEGFTIFLGQAGDIEKLTKYAGGKLGCTIKERQPVIWNDTAALNERLFAPQSVGNVAATEQWGKMFLLDRVSMVPSRMRGGPKGRRYWEFRLTFDKLKALNGLWAVSEEAARGTEIPFFLFRLKTSVPFWKRGEKRHEREAKEMPTWQKAM